MRITITKGQREDTIEAVRPNGTAVRTTFPHKGPVPHDAVHFYVESVLGIATGFWGMVAAGRHPEDISGIAKAAGHASASRAEIPDPSIISIIQAERAVECFEADLWGGGTSDPETVRGMFAAGCAQSLVPALALGDDAVMQIQTNLRELMARWAVVATGESVVLDWAGATV